MAILPLVAGRLLPSPDDSQKVFCVKTVKELQKEKLLQKTVWI